MRRNLFISLLITVCLSVLLSACGQKGFDGTRVANPDSYRLDIEQMTGTDTHTMELDAGDVLDIRFKTEHGKLSMEIKAPDGTPVYTGNGEEATDFTVNISDRGVYSVFVEAHNAKGRISVQRKAAGAKVVSCTCEKNGIWRSME